jgi:hypothetical protein
MDRLSSLPRSWRRLRSSCRVLSARTTLALEDISTGTAVVIFTENLASTVFVSVAQNIFTNQLKTNIAHYGPDVDASAIIAAGVTEFMTRAPEGLIDAVLFAYNESLDQTFYVGVTLSCFGIFCVLGLKSGYLPKGKRTSMLPRMILLLE